MYGNQDSRSKALNRRMKPTAGSILGRDWAVAMVPCFSMRLLGHLECFESLSCGMYVAKRRSGRASTIDMITRNRHRGVKLHHFCRCATMPRLPRFEDYLLGRRAPNLSVAPPRPSLYGMPTTTYCVAMVIKSMNANSLRRLDPMR